MSSNDTEWIANASDDARRGNAKTPDAVWSRLTDLLRTTLIQKPIPAMELQKIAMQLIEGVKTLEDHSDQRS
jgi:hypothetical protein